MLSGGRAGVEGAAGPREEELAEATASLLGPPVPVTVSESPSTCGSPFACPAPGIPAQFLQLPTSLPVAFPCKRPVPAHATDPPNISPHSQIPHKQLLAPARSAPLAEQPLRPD